MSDSQCFWELANKVRLWTLDQRHQLWNNDEHTEYIMLKINVVWLLKCYLLIKAGLIYTRLNYTIIGSDNGLSPVQCQAIPNQCRITINGTLDDTFQWNLNPNATVFTLWVILFCHRRLIKLYFTPSSSFDIRDNFFSQRLATRDKGMDK